MSLSVVLSEAYNFFRNHLSQLAAFTFPLLLAQVGIQLWLGSEFKVMDESNPQFGGAHFFAMMMLLVIFSMLIASLTLFLQVRSEGNNLSAGALLKASLPFVPPLLLAGVFSGMAVIAPVMIAAALGPLWIIGLVLSLYIFSRLAYVNFMVVAERLTPLEAIKASFQFSSPIVLHTIGLLLLYVPLMLIGGAVGTLLSGAGMPVQLLIESLFAFIGLFVNVALFRLYMVTRAKA